MTAETTYNGWTNYETWGVALVLDNDEGTYRMVRELAGEAQAAARSIGLEGLAASHPNVPEIWTTQQAAQFELAERLKDLTEELCGLEEDPGPSLMARQVIGAGLADVNWAEIAANILAES